MANYAYTVRSRIWYAESVPLPDRVLEEITITKPHPGGGVYWEFMLRHRQLGEGNTAWLVEVFDDTWKVFDELRNFFFALRRFRQPVTLKKLEKLFEEHGFEDATITENPSAEPLRCPSCGQECKQPGA